MATKITEKAGFNKLLDKAGVWDLLGGFGPILIILVGLIFFVAAFFAGSIMEGIGTFIMGIMMIYLAFGGAS